MGLPRDGDTERQDSGVRRRGALRVHFPPLPLLLFSLLHLSPLSGCHVLFVYRGRLSSDGGGARGLSRLAGERGGLGSTKRSSALAWEEERGSRQWRELRREEEREREMQPFSHVFDMGAFPTGVKKEGLTGRGSSARTRTQTSLCHLTGHRIH